jgi:hypothetical protein
MGKLRQGIARLIDSDAEGLIDKDELEPRMIRLRQRLARVEEHRQALAEEAALQTDLQLMIGRLEDVAAKVHSGLEAADWTSQRDLIRALVKRVEVAQNEVNIVFRVDPYPGDADPEKKSLQLCRESDHRPLRAALLRAYHLFAVQDARVQPLLDALQHPAVFDPLAQERQQRIMLQMVEEGADVAVDHLSTPAAEQTLTYLVQGLMRTAARTTSMGAVGAILLGDRLQQHPYGLGHDRVLQGGKPQRTERATALRDQTANDWLRTVRVVDELLV